MKLAALGAVTALIGLAVGIPGLLGIGAYWVVLGFPVRMHGAKVKELQAAAGQEGEPTGGKGRRAPVVDARTFTIGTLLLLALGIPSLAVGILEIGIDAEHDAWRWLPIVVGGLAMSFGVLGAVLYLTGGAISAVADLGPEPEVPATLWIRAVRETGTFINERPRLEFDFLVEPDTTTELSSYEVTKKATVPFTAMGSLRVGDGFRAMVAGVEHPTAMEISWDEPVAGARPDVSSRLADLDRLRSAGQITADEYDAERRRILGSI